MTRRPAAPRAPGRPDSSAPVGVPDRTEPNILYVLSEDGKTWREYHLTAGGPEGMTWVLVGADERRPAG